MDSTENNLEEKLQPKEESAEAKPLSDKEFIDMMNSTIDDLQNEVKWLKKENVRLRKRIGEYENTPPDEQSIEDSNTLDGMRNASKKNRNALEENPNAWKWKNNASQQNRNASEGNANASKENPNALEENQNVLRENLNTSEEKSNALEGDDNASEENNNASEGNRNISEENRNAWGLNHNESPQRPDVALKPEINALLKEIPILNDSKEIKVSFSDRVKLVFSSENSVKTYLIEGVTSPSYDKTEKKQANSVIRILNKYHPIMTDYVQVSKIEFFFVFLKLKAALKKKRLGFKSPFKMAIILIWALCTEKFSLTEITYSLGIPKATLQQILCDLRDLNFIRISHKKAYTTYDNKLVNTTYTITPEAKQLIKSAIEEARAACEGERV